MEYLRFLVVLVAVLQGSLSLDFEPTKNDLHAVVDVLEKLAERGLSSPYGKKPKGPGGTGFINPPTGPGGYGNFPSGEFTWGMPLNLDYMWDLAYAWYSGGFLNSELDRTRALSNITTEILHSRFQCATMKINQMVFYVLKERETEMTADEDNSMYTIVKRLLETYVRDPKTLEDVSKKIVSSSHSYIFKTMMYRVKNFEFKGIAKFIKRMKRFMSKARKTKWTVDEFKMKMAKLVEKSGFDIDECPSADDLWNFHKKMSTLFQKRFAGSWHMRKAKAWLTKFLSPYLVSNSAPVVDQIMAVYKGYVTGAIRNFKEVEKHMTSRNTDDILQFVSKFLTQEQLAYLESIFKSMKGEDDVDDTGSGDESDEDDDKSFTDSTDMPYTSSPDTDEDDDESFTGSTDMPYTSSPDTDEDDDESFTGSPDMDEVIDSGDKPSRGYHGDVY